MKKNFIKGTILFVVTVFFLASPLDAETGKTGPAEEVFGKNFDLVVDPTSGTLSYNFSEETNELQSIIAERDVRLVSDKMKLECDKFDFDAKTKKVSATGKRVKIVQETISAVCGDFTYDPTNGRSILLISPEIVNRDEAGRQTITKGDKIVIEKQENGDTMVQVEGMAKLASEEGSQVTPKLEDAVAPAQKMFGRQFEIVTGEKGELLYTFTQKNELREIVARNEVYISSEQVDLNCDRLEFYSDKNKLLAMGKPVKIFQKTIVAECGRFEYYPDEGKSLMLEDPVILNKDEKGRNMETRGEKIIILQAREGRTAILVEGNAQMIAQEAEKEEPEEEPEEKTPAPVDESTVDLIKNLDIIQE